MNLYIDTCSLINLLSEDKSEYLISNLEFWVNNNYIKLFTHEVILTEWNEHKEKKRNSYRKSLEAKYNNAKEIIQKEKLQVPINLEPNTEAIDKLISRMDALLNKATKFETSTPVKAKSSEKAIHPKKAPFHNKLDSMKDAYIIFSALEHFAQNLESFTFISDNKGEFGDPSDTERKLHHQILEDYPNVVVNYYRDIRWAINDFRNLLDASLVLEESSFQNENQIAGKVFIDTNKPLLDQLTDYLEKIHEDVVFIPPRILVNHYPFVLTNPNNAYYSLFNAETVNDQLIELFEKFNRDENGKLPDNLQDIFIDVKDAANKCEKVLTYLTRDLIFTISSRNGDKSIPIRYVTQQTCECPNCEFQRFNFSSSFKKLNEAIIDEKSCLNLGYLNYHIGNYKSAVNLMSRALEIAHKKKLNTTSFILQFNLSKLWRFMSFNYLGNSEHENTMREISEIDPKSLITKYAKPENKDMLEFLGSSKFYYDARDRIFDLHLKIVDGYYESLKGSRSSNYHVWSLKNQFVETVVFLNDNRIVYDRFSEFYTLCDRVFEAMFASHAIDESGGSRLDSFDDWTMQQILIYADADKLNRYYSRYKLKKLTYRDSENKGDSLVELLNNFFSNFLDIKDVFLHHCEHENKGFWAYYNKVFCNAITLISITDFAKETIGNLCNKILNYLRHEDLIHRYNVTHVRNLLVRVGKKLDTETLIEFLWVFIYREKYHDEYCIDAIIDVLNSRKQKIELTDEDFHIIKRAFVKYDSESQIIGVSRALVLVCDVLKNDSLKSELKNVCKSYLKNNFDFFFYYHAVIFDVIEYDPVDLKKILENIIPTNRHTIGSIFGQKNNRFDRVNDFINICFKLNIDTRSDDFKSIKELDPYYDWLLDMENFDYSNFKPSWIGEYRTKFYLKQIANSLDTRIKLEEYLKSESDSSIEKNYYNIFVRKPWD